MDDNWLQGPCCGVALRREPMIHLQLATEPEVTTSSPAQSSSSLSLLLLHPLLARRSTECRCLADRVYPLAGKGFLPVPGLVNARHSLQCPVARDMDVYTKVWSVCCRLSKEDPWLGLWNGVYSRWGSRESCKVSGELSQNQKQNVLVLFQHFSMSACDE